MKDFNFLLLAFTIIVLPYLLSYIFKLRKIIPLVIVQILVGIILGPSLLGRFAPNFFQNCIDASTVGTISGIASIAVLFFGFITGLHTDRAGFEKRGRAFIAIASASMVVPGILGIAGGLFIGSRHPEAIGAAANLYTFAAGVAICVSVTALPVLGAILHEMNLLGEKLANEALAIAAFNDAALWILLSVLIAQIDGAGAANSRLFIMIGGLLLYFAVMIKIVRPFFARYVVNKLSGGKGEAALTAAFACAIGSGMITQAIGLHYIFGAFFAGAIMPRELKQSILARLETATISVLMPFFFVINGLRTFIDFSSPLFAEVLLTTLSLSIIGKIGGTAITSMMTGGAWRPSLALGTLVQTKGLMEIIVLTILLEKNILSSASFSAMIIMAVIGTAIVMPITRLLLAPRQGRVALHAIK